MAIPMLAAVEFNKIPALQFVVPVVAADPAAYEAGLIYNSTEKMLKFHNGTSWVSLGTGTPSGPAGGDLTGTYPNPGIAPGVIVDADVAAANKDGAAATPSMRTLGSGANQAAPGNDSRFTDSRPPNGNAGGDLSGTYPNPQIAAGVIVDADVAAANKDGAVGTPSMRTLGGGAQQALPGNTRLDQVAIPTASVNLNSQKIINLLNPTAAQDAATKAYVDLTSQGFSFKEPCRVCQDAATPTLSGFGPFDGVTLVAGDRVLVNGTVSPSANGIYVAASGAWTRATDADAVGEIKDGMLVTIAEGTVYADSVMICYSVTSPPWAPGTSGAYFGKFLTVNDLVAGTGMTKTGNTINVIGDANLQVAADIINVLSAPKWTTARSIALTGDVTGTAASVDGSANVSIATTFVPPVGVAKHWAGDIPITPSATAPLITHNLGTKDVVVQVYRNSTPWDTVLCDVERTSTTTVTLKFASAVTAGQYRAVVTGR